MAVSVDLSRPAEETQGYSSRYYEYRTVVATSTSTVQARKPNVTILPLWKKNLCRRTATLRRTINTGIRRTVAPIRVVWTGPSLPETPRGGVILSAARFPPKPPKREKGFSTLFSFWPFSNIKVSQYCFGETMMAASTSSEPEGSVLLSRLQAAAEAAGEALDLRPLVRGAACLGDEDTLLLLLGAGGGALLNSDDDGDFSASCLCVAVREGRHGALKQLLEAGAPPDAHTPETHPLCDAAEKGSVAMVESLLLAGADANGDPEGGRRPLYFAAKEGHRAVVEQLLEAGADRDEVSGENEETALCVASEYGHAGAVEALLKAGADVDKGRGGNGYTPLMLAISHMQLAGNEAPCLVLKLLLEAGADANKESEWPNSVDNPLSLASEYDRVDVCEMLLAAGADIELFGGNALWNAVRHSNRNVALLLTRRKASKDDLTRAELDSLAEWLAEDIEARDMERERLVSGIPAWCAEAASCSAAAASPAARGRGRGRGGGSRKRKQRGR